MRRINPPLRRSWRFKIVVGLVLSLTLITLYYFPYSYIWGALISPTIGWIVQWSQVLSSISSIILTGSLVFLYYQQKKILKLDHEPKLIIEDFSGGSGAEYSLQISNLGKGVATDLVLTMQPRFLNEIDYRMDQSSVPLKRLERGQKAWITEGDYLEPNERSIRFTGNSIFFMSSTMLGEPIARHVVGSDGFQPFDDTLPQEIKETDKLRVVFSIKYTKQDGETEQHEFADLVLPLSGSTEDVLDESLTLSQYELLQDESDVVENAEIPEWLRDDMD